VIESIAPLRVTAPLLVVLTSACSQASPAEDQQLDFIQMDMLTLKNGHGLYAANRGGTITEIPFPLELGKVDPSRGHDSEKIGQTDAAVVMFDRYATRAQPGEACFDPQKGREAFVRVFSLEQRRQTFSRAVASCREGLAAADPPVTWLGAASFRIEGIRPQSFRITDTGRVEATP
jgi:hypothetical protein